ncbi:hypothetical protein ABK040_010558 [Willaertia magna]
MTTPQEQSPSLLPTITNVSSNNNTATGITTATTTSFTNSLIDKISNFNLLATCSQWFYYFSYYTSHLPLFNQNNSNNNNQSKSNNNNNNNNNTSFFSRPIIFICFLILLFLLLLLLRKSTKQQQQQQSANLIKNRNNNGFNNNEDDDEASLFMMKLIADENGNVEMKNVKFVIQQLFEDNNNEEDNQQQQQQLSGQGQHASKSRLAGNTMQTNEDLKMAKEIIGKLAQVKRLDIEQLKKNVIAGILHFGGKDLIRELKIGANYVGSTTSMNNGNTNNNNNINNHNINIQMSPSTTNTVQAPTYSNFRYHNTYLFYPPTNTAEHDLTPSSWMLENVCMNYLGELLYFEEKENTKLSPILQKFLYDTFDEKKYVGTIQAWKRGIRGSVSVKTVHQSIPKQTIALDGRVVPTTWIEKPVLATVRYAAGNIGHFLADNLAPNYELIAKFGIDPKEVVVFFMDEVFYRPCSPDASDTYGWSHNLCPEYMSSFFFNKTQAVMNSLQWTHLMTRQPVLQRCTYKVYERQSTFGTELFEPKETNHMIFRVESAPCPLDDKFTTTTTTNAGTGVAGSTMNRKKRSSTVELGSDELYKLRDSNAICFKKLIFGVGDRALIPNRTNTRFRELALLGLRKVLLDNLGLPKKKKRGDKIIVAIQDKSKEIQPSNTLFAVDEIANYIRVRIQRDSLLRDKLKLGVPIEVVTVKIEKMNLIEQVEFFSQVDVYITTIGSGSFYSLFMPEGSFLLYAPECTRHPSAPEQEFQCKHPIMYVHTSMSHMSVVDITSTVKGCKYKEEINGVVKEGEPCAIVFDISAIYREVLHAVISRAAY